MDIIVKQIKSKELNLNIIYYSYLGMTPNSILKFHFRVCWERTKIQSAS